MTTQLRHTLHCTRTGVPLGYLDLSPTAGHVPYMSHWHEMVCYHPLFSLSEHKLIEFMSNEWARLAKDVINENVSDSESILLRVGFVAVLHNLGSIRQDRDAIGLPLLQIVQNNLESLLGLSAWKHFLDSKRFHFPELHISRFNDNSSFQSVADYIDACWQRKREYEAGLDDVREQERARIAERAILSIRNSFAKPTSKKLLWTWIQGNLPSKWKNDAWLKTIFLAGSGVITDWDWDELELFEEILQASLPQDSPVITFAVRERINEIKRIWKDHYDTFTIEEDSQAFIVGLEEEHKNDPEPKLADYPTKAQFFVAKARWDLAHRVSYTKPSSPEVDLAKNKFYNSSQVGNL